MTIEYWTNEDAYAGLCELEQVGDVRDTPRVETLAAPDTGTAAAPPLTRSQRKLKVQSIIDGILQAIAKNPAAALDDNGSTINKLIDLASKFDDKDEAQKPKPAEQMTALELQTLIISGMMPEQFGPFWEQLEAGIAVCLTQQTEHERLTMSAEMLTKLRAFLTTWHEPD